MCIFLTSKRALSVSFPFFMCAGDQLAMIDFMLWPWFERFSLISQKVPTLTLSDNSNPKLYAWIKVMMQQPAVKETYFDPETHSKFYQLYLEGNRQAYDIGLDP